jgi:hypothetical protein
LPFAFWAFEFCFGLFGVRSFWKGKELLKRKIAEGKRNANEGLVESLH